MVIFPVFPQIRKFFGTYHIKNQYLYTETEIWEVKFMLRPLSDRIILRSLDKIEKTAGGIFLPDSAKEKPAEAEVVAVGPGLLNSNGKLVVPDVKAGDKVIYAKYAGTEVKVDGINYIIIRNDDILGIVE